MKLKTILAVLTLSMIFAITGCGKSEEPKTAEIETQAVENDSDIEESTENADDVNVQESLDDEATEISDTESGKPLAIMTQKYYENYFDQVDGEYKTIADSTAEGIVIFSDGYDSLKNAMKEYSESAQKGAADFSNEAKEIFESDGIEGIGPGGNWFYEDTVKLERADDKYLSFFSINSSYTGGAHPYTGSFGHTYDTMSGEIVALSDIVNDYDALMNVVIDEIKKYEYADDLFEDWEETVKNDFNPVDDGIGGINWVLTDTAIKMVFNAYELGSYAMGPVNIIIDADSHDGLFAEGVFTKKDKTVWAPDVAYGNSYMEFSVDLDNDGEAEYVTVNGNAIYADDEQAGGADAYLEGTDVTIGIGKNISDAYENTVTFSAEIELNRAYVMKNSEGKYYLYVETTGYNDYRILTAYDINDITKPPVEVKCDGGSFYGFIPLDSHSFRILDRIDVMGTYSAYSDCMVGENGNIVSVDDMLTVLQYDDIDRSVTLKMDINGLKSGDKLIPYATNGKDVMQFITESGEKVDFKYDKVDSWPRTINDIDEEEIFDDLIYAG